MNKQEMIIRLYDKIDEQKKWIETNKLATDLSDNTYKTQKYKRERENVLYGIIATLLDDNELTVEQMEKLESYTTPSADRKTVKVEVWKGATLMELLQRYSGVKDVLNKIQKACDNQGLKLNMSTGKVE